MTPEQHLALIYARSDQILWLWVAYLAGAAGTVAFAVAAPRDRRTLRWLTVGFLFAAYTHLECMRWVVKQWNVLAHTFVGNGHYHRSAAEYRDLLDGVIHAPHPGWIVPFHLVLDALVLAAVWKLARRPLESA